MNTQIFEGIFGRQGATETLHLFRGISFWLTCAMSMLTIGVPMNAGAAGQISGGGHHTVAVKSDGTVWAWGANDSGQLGDGTTVGRTTPLAVGGLSSVSVVRAGEAHSLALKSDGTVWAWGRNGFGQLGDATTTSRSAPVQVGGLSGVVAVAAGGNHSLALKNDGSVWAWGGNGQGQLGDGTTTLRSTPVQVSGLGNMIAVAVGEIGRAHV